MPYDPATPFLVSTQGKSNHKHPQRRVHGEQSENMGILSGKKKRRKPHKHLDEKAAPGKRSQAQKVTLWEASVRPDVLTHMWNIKKQNRGMGGAHHPVTADNLGL